MSTWHVNSEWADFHAVDGGPVTWIDATADFADPNVTAGDALTAPTVDDLLPSGLALWPRGAAWGTPDGEAPSLTSVFARLTSAILSVFADLYARAWRLTEEARSASIVDSLEEWEAEFGLPDPCSTGEMTAVDRMATLRARVAGLPSVTPADIVMLAARLGYVVAIEEPDAFITGVSSLAGLGELSNSDLEQQWVVIVREVPASQFEAGIAETGVTRLLDFDNGRLECAIRRIAPAWTRVVFNYAEQPIGLALETGDGSAIVTETGKVLVVSLLPSNLS